LGEVLKTPSREKKSCFVLLTVGLFYLDEMLPLEIKHINRRRWEDSIKMDFQEVGGGCGDWMELAQDRDRWRALVSTVKKLRVP
jgi:hypothetical protein